MGWGCLYWEDPWAVPKQGGRCRSRPPPSHPCPSSGASGLSLWGHLPRWLGLGAWCQVTTHWQSTPE